MYNADGEELLNYWFTGFYPADAPQYTITVMQDGILKPETSSAALFERITEILMCGRGPDEGRVSHGNPLWANMARPPLIIRFADSFPRGKPFIASNFPQGIALLR